MPEKHRTSMVPVWRDEGCDSRHRLRQRQYWCAICACGFQGPQRVGQVRAHRDVLRHLRDVVRNELRGAR